MKTQYTSETLSLILGFVLLLFVVNTGCNTAKESGKSIAELEAQFKSETNKEAGTSIDTEKIKVIMNDLAVAYEQHAAENPDSAAKYLYKAAEMYETNQMDIGKALELYKKMTTEYADHSRSADAMFKMGYIYHNVLNDLPNAEKIYKEFLTKHPNHVLATSAQFEINNLGVSPEEILKRIRPDSTESDSSAVEEASAQ